MDHAHTDFNEAAATWDDDPAKLARSVATAEAIAAAVPLDGVRDALEFGCGTGQVTWALGDRLPHVILADSAPGMLAVVEQRIAALPHDRRARYEPMLLDLGVDSLPPASLDLVYASMSLHHVPDVPLALRRIAEALRPGGHLAIADLDHDRGGHFHGTGFDGHHGFERTALASALVDAGFAAPSFQTVTTLTKDTVDGPREFPVFLAVAALA